MRRGTVKDGVMTVDLTAPTEDVNYPWSEANRYWNTQALLAMDRAGMISLEWPTPPDVPADSRDEELQEIFATRRNSMSIRIRQGDLADRARLPPALPRRAVQESCGDGRVPESAMRILDGLSTCINRYLAEHYHSARSPAYFPRSGSAGAVPTAARTGCSPS